MGQPIDPEAQSLEMGAAETRGPVADGKETETQGTSQYVLQQKD